MKRLISLKLAFVVLFLSVAPAITVSGAESTCENGECIPELIAKLEGLGTQYEKQCTPGDDHRISEECWKLITEIGHLENEVVARQSEMESKLGCEGGGCQGEDSNDINTQLANLGKVEEKLSCTMEKKTEIRSKCGGELSCVFGASLLSLTGTGYVVDALLPKNFKPKSCHLGDDGCMVQLATGFIKSVFTFFEGAWDLLKMGGQYVGKKAGEFWDWVSGPDDHAGTSQLALAKASEDEGFFKQLTNDFPGTMSKLFEALVASLKEWMKTDVFCKKWDGVPHFGTCVEPLENYDCLSCKSFLTGMCSMSGTILAEIVPAFLTGGLATAAKHGVNGAGKIAKLFKISPKALEIIKNSKGVNLMVEAASKADDTLRISRGLLKAKTAIQASLHAIGSYLNGPTRKILQAAQKKLTAMSTKGKIFLAETKTGKFIVTGAKALKFAGKVIIYPIENPMTANAFKIGERSFEKIFKLGAPKLQLTTSVSTKLVQAEPKLEAAMARIEAARMSPKINQKKLGQLEQELGKVVGSRREELLGKALEGENPEFDEIIKYLYPELQYGETGLKLGPEAVAAAEKELLEQIERMPAGPQREKILEQYRAHVADGNARNKVLKISNVTEALKPHESLRIISDAKADPKKVEALNKFIEKTKARGTKIDQEFVEDLDRIHTTGELRETGLDSAKGREMAKFLKKYPKVKREELLELAKKDVGVLGKKVTDLDKQIVDISNSVGKNFDYVDMLHEMGYTSEITHPGIRDFKKGTSELRIPIHSDDVPFKMTATDVKNLRSAIRHGKGTFSASDWHRVSEAAIEKLRKKIVINLGKADVTEDLKLLGVDKDTIVLPQKIKGPLPAKEQKIFEEALSEHGYYVHPDLRAPYIKKALANASTDIDLIADIEKLGFRQVEAPTNIIRLERGDDVIEYAITETPTPFFGKDLEKFKEVLLKGGKFKHSNVASMGGKFVGKVTKSLEPYKAYRVVVDAGGDKKKLAALNKFIEKAQSKGVPITEEFVRDLTMIHITGVKKASGLDPAKGRQMAKFLKKYPKIKREELLELAKKEVGVLGLSAEDLAKMKVEALSDLESWNFEYYMRTLGYEVDDKATKAARGIVLRGQKGNTIEIPGRYERAHLKLNGDEAVKKAIKDAIDNNTNYRHPKFNTVVLTDEEVRVLQIEDFVEQDVGRNHGYERGFEFHGYELSSRPGVLVATKDSSVIEMPQLENRIIELSPAEKVKLKKAMEEGENYTHPDVAAREAEHTPRVIDDILKDIGGSYDYANDFKSLGFEVAYIPDGYLITKGKTKIRVPAPRNNTRVNFSPAEKAKLRKVLEEGGEYIHPDLESLPMTSKSFEHVIPSLGVRDGYPELIGLGFVRTERPHVYVFTKGDTVIELPKFGYKKTALPYAQSALDQGHVPINLVEADKIMDRLANGGKYVHPDIPHLEGKVPLVLNDAAKVSNARPIAEASGAEIEKYMRALQGDPVAGKHLGLEKLTQAELDDFKNRLGLILDSLKDSGLDPKLMFKQIAEKIAKDKDGPKALREAMGLAANDKIHPEARVLLAQLEVLMEAKKIPQDDIIKILKKLGGTCKIK